MNERPRNDSPVNELIDPRLARLYREAVHEEPPADLDAAILAAARREAGARPHEVTSQTDEVASPEAASASGPAPGFRPARYFPRAWRLPVSLAAVMVLTVSVVTLTREHDGERKAEPSPKLPQPMAKDTRTPELRNEERFASGRIRAFSAPSAQQSAAPQAPGPSAVASSASKLAAEYADEPPEKWGEKIVDLRRQGRFAEADELLAEFRRRFPDRVVPDAWTR